MTTEKNFKAISLIVLTLIILFLSAAYENQKNKLTLENQKNSNAESNKLTCEPTKSEQEDELSMIINQPSENLNSCLFVGCNSFF